MARKRKGLTPQEKKVRSYQHDRRNSYGENDKASRKNIPRSKARAQRSYRSRVKQALHSGRSDEPDVEASKLHRKGDFKKAADQPLADYLEAPLPRRGAPPLQSSPLRKEAKRRLRRAKNDK